MKLTIQWIINNKHIEKFSFIKDGKPICMPNLEPIFSSVKDMEFHADEKQQKEYKAILHIQEGMPFFNNRHISQKDGLPINPAYCFAQESLFYPHEDGKEMLPIIHFSAWPLQADEKSDKYNVFFPRYARIMDSSIWNFFFLLQIINMPIKDSELSYQIAGLEEKEKEQLRWIIDSITQYTDRGIYDLAVAKEYADANARLVQQSYIAGDGGHSHDVSTFLFHSEWEMKADREIIDKKYKWRFLLVDDHAWTSMSNTIAKKKEESLTIQDNSKLKIIENTIQEMGLSVGLRIFNSHKAHETNLDKECNVEIWGVQTIKEAIAALNENKYDIILLDYLLGKHSMNEEDKHNDKDKKTNKDVLNYKYESPREYAYQLLSRINDDPSLIQVGPSGKQFFMFISAFTTAVGERLRSEGLRRTTDKWYIAEGACPTNTPYLFQYYLSRVMLHRLEDSGINSLSESHILKITSHIFKEKPEDVSIGRIKAVRERAFDTYHEFLDLHHKYALLKKDKGQSRLVDSFLENKVHMGAMLEHLLQLIHLTAFGTIRQWPEIWEEYKFFTRTFSHKNELASEVTELSRNIEQYIITLKSA